LHGKRHLVYRENKHLIGQTIQSLFVGAQAGIAPIIPTNSFDSGVSESGREEGRASPGVGHGRTGHLRDDWSDIGLEPSRARTDVGRIQTTLELIGTRAFFEVRIKCGVTGAVYRDARKNEEERVGDECGGRLREAERPTEVTPKQVLGSVIRDGQGSGDTDDVLGAGAPEVLVDGTVDEFVEESVIHLQESSRKMWYGHIGVRKFESSTSK
jgi:hypothetical protein